MELKVFEGAQQPSVLLGLLQKGNDVVQLCIVDENGVRKGGGTLFEVIIGVDGKLRGRKMAGINPDLPVALDCGRNISDF